jgi:hypothetical protein
MISFKNILYSFLFHLLIIIFLFFSVAKKHPTHQSISEKHFSFYPLKSTTLPSSQSPFPFEKKSKGTGTKSHEVGAEEQALESLSHGHQDGSRWKEILQTFFIQEQQWIQQSLEQALQESKIADCSQVHPCCLILKGLLTSQNRSHFFLDSLEIKPRSPFTLSGKEKDHLESTWLEHFQKRPIFSDGESRGSSDTPFSFQLPFCVSF